MESTLSIRSLAVATDTALASLSGERDSAADRIVQVANRIHIVAGDKDTRTRRGPVCRWSMTLTEALAVVEAPDFRISLRFSGAKTYQVAAMLTELADARAEVDRLGDEIAALNAVWAEHLWSRFFLVTSSNGHIHKDMDCMSCFPDTTFGWLPGLSGLTEADAVKAHGSILCTFCFPTAPAEWTAGEAKSKIEAREAREAKAAAKEAKRLEKALLPDGSVLVAGGDRIVTLAAAKSWLTESAWWETVTTARGQTRHVCYGVADTLTVAAAVAAKTGETIEEVIAAAVKRAAKRG